jgi:hypothetical protein
MRRIASARIVLAAVLLAAPGSAAMAGPHLGSSSKIVSPRDYPGAPRPVQEKSKSPYAMNYAEEAVQSLGLKDGRVEAFSTSPGQNQPYMPSFSGNIGSKGAMLELQWHPGE